MLRLWIARNWHLNIMNANIKSLRVIVHCPLHVNWLSDLFFTEIQETKKNFNFKNSLSDRPCIILYVDFFCSWSSSWAYIIKKQFRILNWEAHRHNFLCKMIHQVSLWQWLTITAMIKLMDSVFNVFIYKISCPEPYILSLASEYTQSIYLY